MGMLFNFHYFKKVYYALFLLLFIILVGTIGYIVIEDYSFAEAFYMTIITVSTVGFGEIKPLSDFGRIFTSFLIIFSFGTFAFAIGSITQYLVGGEYRDYFKYYTVHNQIDKIKNHVIICGFGRNGKQAARTLSAYKQKYIIVESNEELLEKLREEKQMYVPGDAKDEANLIKAKIKDAKALITTLPNDADNVFVVLTARELNSKIRIISRASLDSSERKLHIAGANNVIMPDKVGGAHMAETLMSPDVLEFIDHLSVQGPSSINLEAIPFDKIPAQFHGHTIGKLDATYNTGATIIGFRSPLGEFLVNPNSEIQLVSGSTLFVLGSTEQIQELNKIFEIQLS